MVESAITNFVMSGKNERNRLEWWIIKVVDCTVKYQTAFFYYGPSNKGARSMQKTEVRYFTVQTEQVNCEVNNLFIMWLNNFIIWLFKILYSDWLRSGPEKTHIQTVVSIFRIWTSVPDGSFSNETLVYCSALHMMFIDFHSNKIAFSFFWTIIVFRCL
jgi:hypothetical protein